MLSIASRCRGINAISMYMWRNHFIVHECRTLSYSGVFEMLHFNIETCTTATAAGSKGVVCNLKLRTNQLHREVNFAALEEVKGWFIEYDFRTVLRSSSRISVIGDILENRVVFVNDGGPFSSILGR
jgi:hypothetical protein